MTVIDKFNAGDLPGAIDAAAAEVRADPSSVTARVRLAELMCFTGDLERVDAMLDAAVCPDNAATLAVNSFRRVIQAEAARRDFYKTGRMPHFLDEPGEEAKLRLEAALMLREGRPADSANMLERADALRPVVSGTHAGQPFEDIRDGDDLLGPFLEVLGSDGHYYWVPMSGVLSLSFTPPSRPSDLLFRPARLTTPKAEGEVYLPVLYANPPLPEDPDLLMGRRTDWSEGGSGGEGVPVLGHGQRVLMTQEHDLPVMELTELVFNTEDASS